MPLGEVLLPQTNTHRENHIGLNKTPLVPLGGPMVILSLMEDMRRRDLALEPLGRRDIAGSRKSASGQDGRDVKEQHGKE